MMNDILDFAEGREGLRIRLRPVQRAILKLIYGLELDNTQKTITIHDGWERRMTEVDYVRYLHGTGRCNFDYSGPEHRRVLLVGGRRSSKTFLGQLISHWESLSNRKERDSTVIEVYHNLATAQYGRRALNRLSEFSNGMCKDLMHKSLWKVVWKGGLTHSVYSSSRNYMHQNRNCCVLMDEYEWFDNLEGWVCSMFPCAGVQGKIVLATTLREPEIPTKENKTETRQLWDNPNNGWLKLSIPTWHTLPNPETLEAMHHGIGEARFRMEVGAEFPPLRG